MNQYLTSDHLKQAQGRVGKFVDHEDSILTIQFNVGLELVRLLSSCTTQDYLDLIKSLDHGAELIVGCGHITLGLQFISSESPVCSIQSLRTELSDHEWDELLKNIQLALVMGIQVFRWAKVRYNINDELMFLPKDAKFYFKSDPSKTCSIGVVWINKNH